MRKHEKNRPTNAPKSDPSPVFETSAIELGEDTVPSTSQYWSTGATPVKLTVTTDASLSGSHCIDICCPWMFRTFPTRRIVRP